ncbi:hypothetical protein HN51_064917 [Arachis hypogaea]
MRIQVSRVHFGKKFQALLELDLQPYTISHQNNNVPLKYELYAVVPLKYVLYAVVVHIGFSSTSGHYFSFVRSAPDTWHKLDDSKVDDTAQLLALLRILGIQKFVQRFTEGYCDQPPLPPRPTIATHTSLGAAVITREKNLHDASWRRCWLRLCRRVGAWRSDGPLGMVRGVGNVVFNEEEIRPMASSPFLHGHSGCRRQRLVADRCSGRGCRCGCAKVDGAGALFGYGSGCRL